MEDYVAEDFFKAKCDWPFGAIGQSVFDPQLVKNVISRRILGNSLFKSNFRVKVLGLTVLSASIAHSFHC